MPDQLTFDLPARVSQARGDFFVSDANKLAVARLDAPETWPNHKLVLVGPEGSGKSHLAQVWADAVGAKVVAASELTSWDIPAQEAACAVEIPDQMQAEEEEALFHLHNHMGSHGLAFLMLARRPPAQWEIALPDLKSRLLATDSVRIDPPDDALLAAVLLKQFSDRQLQVPPSLIQWAVPRMERSFAAVGRLVDMLDKSALAEKRPITRELARQILDNSA